MFLIVVLSIGENTRAQQPALIYLKTLPTNYIFSLGNPNYALQYFPEDSIYTLKLWTESGSADFGVWSESVVNGLDPEFEPKLIVYNRNLEPIRTIQGGKYSFLRTIGVKNQKVYLNGYQDDVPFESIPEVQWTHSPVNQNAFLFEFDLDENTLTERLCIRDSVPGTTSTNYSHIPYPGYATASGYVGMEEAHIFSSSRNMVLLQNELAIGGVNTYLTEYVNQIPYENTTLNMGYLSVKYNLLNQNTSVSPVGPFNQSKSFNFRYFASENGNAYYRVASFRGAESQANPAGDTFSAVTDSSYVTYITKENENGESQFITPLYSYNNLRPDTVGIMGFYYNHQKFYSLVELGNKVFLAGTMKTKMQTYPTDSLYFQDCFGHDTVYHQMVDYIVPDYEPNEAGVMPYAKNWIIALSGNGVPEIKLTTVNSYLGMPYNTVQSLPILFKVGDSLAWVTNYKALNDSTLTLVKETAANTTDTTTVDLPAGKAACIFWLNDELDLIDFWRIPYSSPDFLGVELKYIREYRPDTLLIQGVVTPNTTVRLDPFAANTSINFAEDKTFLAFYSGLNSVDIAEAKPEVGFTVFPNPADGTLTIKQEKNRNFTAYAIYDLSGRKVREGTLPAGHSAIIEINKLTAGMYILKCTGNDQTASTKFVVK